MTEHCRRTFSAAIAVLLLGNLAVAPSPAYAQPTAATGTPQQDEPVDRRLLLVGVGAIAGALAFNVFSAPFGTVPLAGGVLEAVPQEVALGSRLIAVAATGAGAIGGTWLYDRWVGERTDFGYVASLLVGAAAGVAVGNYLMAGTVGSPPYYLGAGAANAAGAMASTAAQAASRVYVVGTAVMGTWAADWLYRR